MSTRDTTIVTAYAVAYEAACRAYRATEREVSRASCSHAKQALQAMHDAQLVLRHAEEDLMASLVRHQDASGPLVRAARQWRLAYRAKETLTPSFDPATTPHEAIVAAAERLMDTSLDIARRCAFESLYASAVTLRARVRRHNRKAKGVR